MKPVRNRTHEPRPEPHSNTGEGKERGKRHFSHPDSELCDKLKTSLVVHPVKATRRAMTGGRQFTQQTGGNVEGLSHRCAACLVELTEGARDGAMCASWNVYVLNEHRVVLLQRLTPTSKILGPDLSHNEVCHIIPVQHDLIQDFSTEVIHRVRPSHVAKDPVQHVRCQHNCQNLKGQGIVR